MFSGSISTAVKVTFPTEQDLFLKYIFFVNFLQIIFLYDALKRETLQFIKFIAVIRRKCSTAPLLHRDLGL